MGNQQADAHLTRPSPLPLPGPLFRSKHILYQET
jgi:hypothetical protein